MPTPQKSAYLRAGSFSAAIASVAGLAWAAVKTISWATAFVASVNSMAANVSTLKTDLAQLKERQDAATARIQERATTRFRQNEKTTQKIAVALASLQTEVRVRHHEPPSPGAGRRPLASVTADTNRALATASMAASMQQTAAPPFSEAPTS